MTAPVNPATRSIFSPAYQCIRNQVQKDLADYKTQKIASNIFAALGIVCTIVAVMGSVTVLGLSLLLLTKFDVINSITWSILLISSLGLGFTGLFFLHKVTSNSLIINIIYDTSPFPIEENLSNRNGQNFSAMQLAAYYGDIELLDTFFQQPGIRADDSAIIIAAIKGHADVLKLLLQYYDKETGIIIPIDAIISIIRHNDLSVLRILHKFGVLEKENRSFTTLHEAAKTGKIEIIRACVQEFKIPINNKTYRRITPLCIAVLNGQEKAVEELIKLGANIHESEDYWEPLHLAAAYGYPEIIEILVIKGISVDHSDYPKQMTPLQMAVRASELDSVKKLLELGANVEYEDGDYNLAIDYACQEDAQEFITARNLGIDPNDFPPGRIQIPRGNYQVKHQLLLELLSNEQMLGAIKQGKYSLDRILAHLPTEEVCRASKKLISKIFASTSYMKPSMGSLMELCAKNIYLHNIQYEEQLPQKAVVFLKTTFFEILKQRWEEELLPRLWETGP